MLLKPHAIRDEDTFASHNQLGRVDLADGLLNFVETMDGPSVTAVDARWGTGKTFFLSLWKNMLTKNHVPVIYFNAFRHDFSSDPFVELAGEVIELTDAVDGVEDEKVKLRRAAKSVARGIARAGANVGLRAVTAGVVQLADAEGAIQAAIRGTGDQLENVLDDVFDDRAERHSRREAFRSSLASISREASPTGKVVFIIDELDRCRPSFAVEILEQVKHFFDAPGYHLAILYLTYPSRSTS